MSSTGRCRAGRPRKITYFLHNLPKATRRELTLAGGTLGDVARSLAETLVPFDGPMMPALAKALSVLTGSRVTADLSRPTTPPGTCAS